MPTERLIGTVVRGIRAPIVRQGDDIAQIVVDNVINATASENIPLNDKDVVAVTEAVIARAQGNYVSVDQIADDIKHKFEDGQAGVIFPILSRNRFAVVLRGIAMGLKKMTLMLSYPADEVGNHLLTLDQLDEKNVNPYTDVLSEDDYRQKFGRNEHPFTGVDYVEYYKEVVEQTGCQIDIILANRPEAILNYTKNVLVCDIHSRERTKRILKNNGAGIVFSLADIMNKPVNDSGFNENYGLLGSNKAAENSVKLFPRNTQDFVDKVADSLLERTGKKIEVMVYGDGAFKDPVGKIWELADPVVSPAFTSGLDGTPNELKLKYLADNDFADLSGDELKQAVSEKIRNKDGNLKGSMLSQGTTPRRLTDLIGSLCDLTSGSGDKGTPIVFIQGYFDNYTE